MVAAESHVERYHALDAVRAFALLAGIVLHATMSFIPGFTLNPTRPSLDVSPSATLGVLFFTIHIFRMSLFFLIAGFFARLLIARRGFREFVRNRVKRVLLPLLGGWLVFAPLVIAAVIYQTLILYERLADAPPLPAGGVPLLHLWFLYYLLWLYALALAVRALLNATLNRTGRIAAALDGALTALMRWELAPFALAAPLALHLYLLPMWEPWTGIPTPDRGLVPKLTPSLAYGTAFVVGWFLHRRANLLELLRCRAWWYVGGAIVLTASSVALAGPTLAAAEPTLMQPGTTRACYAVCYTLAVWYWTFGVIGVGERCCAGYSAVRRYVADSSYWLYLAHLPLAFFLAALVSEWPLHWSVKFPAIVVATTGLLLVSYRYLVRPTFIGALLNGRRAATSATAPRDSRQPT